MKLKNKLFSCFLMIIVVQLLSCKVFKNQPIKVGGIDEARYNVIIDYIRTHSSKNKSFYYIDNYFEYDTKKLHLFIIDKNFTPPILLTDSLGDYTTTFPTNYFKKGNKLFLWRDKHKVLSNEIIDIMEEYKAIDSSFYKNKEIIINTREAKKKLFYFVCKHNISKFKKKKAVWIKPENYPNIKCLK